MAKAVKIKSDNYKFKSDGSVSFSSSALKDVKPEIIAADLKNVVPSIKKTDIKISPTGQVVITNDEFRKALAKSFQSSTKVAGDTNYVACGANWQCKPK